MTKKKTYNLKDLNIGTRLFVVHNKYAFQKILGGKILPARIVSFVNITGQIEPEFRLVGQPSTSSNLRVDNYTIFTDIKEALKAIKS
jgi:hypothetical protein